MKSGIVCNYSRSPVMELYSCNKFRNYIMSQLFSRTVGLTHILDGIERQLFVIVSSLYLGDSTTMLSDQFLASKIILKVDSDFDFLEEDNLIIYVEGIELLTIYTLIES